MTARSRLVATYALCGFGNMVLGQLGRGKKRIFAEVLSALLTAALAKLSSASVVGMVLTDEYGLAVS
jgi:concentrative nucleoside transporter, CNT family